MAKLILHTSSDLSAIEERRLRENFALSHKERMKKAFALIALAAKFKNGVLREPQGLGVVLKRKK